MSIKLSVIMPVYNGESFLKETIESVLNQTFTDFEFIIIDDGSTDKTSEILNEYAKKDNRIRIFRNEQNKRIVYCLNKGLDNASARIIARMDCDDICMPDRFEKQYKFLISNPDIVLVGSQVEFVNIDGKLLYKSLFPTDDYNIRKELFLKKNVIIHPSVMFKWDGELYYREFAYPAEDYDMWLRMAQKGRVAILNDYLLKVRLNPEGTTFSKKILQDKTVDLINKLFKERLNYGEEKILPKNESKETDNTKHLSNFYRLLTTKIIKHKRGSFKWVVFALLFHILFPNNLLRKLEYYIKKTNIEMNKLFKRFYSLK
jgi:glycosyltransferase involved in cell wall biosynthesis